MPSLGYRLQAAWALHTRAQLLTPAGPVLTATPWAPLPCLTAPFSAPQILSPSTVPPAPVVVITAAGRNPPPPCAGWE